MPKVVKVAANECVASIAFEHGFPPETIWNDPANAGLKAGRKNPNVLAPGDEVVVPDRRVRSVACATGRVHRFRRRGVPDVVRLRFLDAAGQPRAGVSYLFEMASIRREGTTDEAGWLREVLPPVPGTARVTLGESEIYVLHVGRLDPVDEVTGLQQRLQNLGYPTAPDPVGELGPATRAAVERFLADRGKPAPGSWDDPGLADVRLLLQEEHTS